MLNKKIASLLEGVFWCSLVSSQVAFPPFLSAQQPNPNEERFLQPALPPEATEETEPIETAPTPAPAPPVNEQPEAEIPLRQIEVVGSTVFEPDVIEAIIQPLEGRLVTLAELQAATDAITRLYQEAGYLTSRAILPQQQIDDGVARIQVIEGSLEAIQIEGIERIEPSYIRQRLRQGARSPLRIDQLEDQLRLLKADPLFKDLEASLQAGSETGQSVLVVKVTEANPIYGNVGINNYSPPSVGSIRLGAELGLRNLTGFGDTFTAAYDHSTTGGLDLFDFNYRLPVNAKNGTIGLHAAISEAEVTLDEVEKLGIEGESELYEVSFRQPLVRTLREEFALAIGFSFRDGQTFIFDDFATPFGIGPDEEGISRTSVFRFGQDYLKRDQEGGWLVRSQFSFGTDLFDATVNDEPIPDSRFFSWLGQIQRVQRLNRDHLLLVLADLQLTPDSLLPSEQFFIGGGQSLRGYRQNARGGDNGFRFVVEDRITLTRNQAGDSVLQVAPFVDLGAVWNHEDNPNELPDKTFLASAGLGLLWEPLPGLNLRLDYGVPFVDIEELGDNLQDDGFHFSVDYGF